MKKEFGIREPRNENRESRIENRESGFGNRDFGKSADFLKSAHPAIGKGAQDSGIGNRGGPRNPESEPRTPNSLVPIASLLDTVFLKPTDNNPCSLATVCSLLV